MRLLAALGVLLAVAAAGEEPVVVRAGARFAVTLEANATTGFRWRLAQPLDEHVVRLLGTEYRAREPRLTGGGGTEVWTFEAVAPGRTSIRLEYVRPWEHDTPPASVRTVGVVVEDPPGALP